MTASNYDAAARLDRPTAPPAPGGRLRGWWTMIAALLVTAMFAEAIFAGAMLSGAGWARKAHAAGAAVLIAATLGAGLVSLATLRRLPHGLKLGLILLSLGLVAFLQAAVGVMTAKGANLLWVHVPLGVALVGFAGQAVASARRLGAE